MAQKKDKNNNTEEKEIEMTENTEKKVEKKTSQKSGAKKSEGPKISMQGISGKEITGVVKVVKKVPADKPATPPVKKEATSESGKVEKVKEQENDIKKAQTSEAPKKEDIVVAETKEKVSPKSVKKDEAKVEKPVNEASNKVTEEATEKPVEKTTKTDGVSQEKPLKKKISAETDTEETKVETTKSRVISDQGISGSSYSGPRFRPQKGNYVGKNKEMPAGDRPRYNNRDQYSRNDRPQAGDRSERPNYRSDRGGDGRFHRGERNDRGPQNRGNNSGFNRTRTNFDNNRRPQTGGRDFMQDKDRDEAPRRSKSPKQKRNDSRYEAQINPDMTDNAKVDFRKQHDKRTSGAKGRKHVDYDRRREDQNRNFEQEKLKQSRKQNKDKPKPQIAQLTNVKLPESLTVRELAEILKKTTADVIAKMMGYGVMATVNQDIDYDTAEVIANDFGIKAEKIIEVTEEDILFDDSEDAEEDLETRPPIVVVMGHVDHGKTSILDYIRNTRVTVGEAGGITQHIGAYTVDVDGRIVTFLDTPGHEAFTTMRARGAQVTDIAILVVAADDGVMPQTIEAINHAKAANTEIIVAINKIDKAGVNIDRVKQELAQHELLAEDWGGQTTMIQVSAKTGENMDELLEMITLTADVMDLKANPNRQAKGTVIESKLDRGRGPVATILVQRGTLRVGDTVVVGSTIGNIRAMTNDRGEQVEEAGPSMPVEILGLPDVPESGEIFYQVTDEKVARSLAARRQVEEREAQLRKNHRMSLDNLFAHIAEGDVKDFNLIVKGDVQGSVEAVRQSLEKLSNDEVKVGVIHGAVGAITESDVRLADVSNAVIIGFNVRPAAGVQDLADQLGVDLRMYRVIYDAINDINDAMKGMLDPKFNEVILGHAQVRETFNVTGIGTIAGCYVTDGTILRSAGVRIVRDGIVVHEGKISSLRRFKDDAREVKSGYECGIGIERYNDLKINDQIEAFEMREVERD